MIPTDTASRSIAYTDSLTGEPVVLVHCSAASGREWDSLGTLLSGEYRKLVPDQWGCGESPAWMGQSAFALAHEAAPIIALIERVGQPVHLIGHSYGGGVALRIAREHPEKIRTLTLIEPSCFHILRNGEAEAEVLLEEISGVAGRITAAFISGGYWSGMASFVDYWNGAGTWEAMSMKARLKATQRLSKVALDFHALFEEPARAEDYAGLAMPTLLLVGERSPGPSRKIVAMLSAAMPNARVERIAGAGHMSPFTHADDVNRRILAHLSAQATPRAMAA